MRRRITYPHVVSTLALIVAMGGTSYAAIRLPASSVGTKQIKPGAVSDAKVRRGTLTQGAFKAGELPKAPRGTVVRSYPIPQSVPPGPSSGTATCKPGEIVVGGGYRGMSEADTDVIGNGPAPNDEGDQPTGWTVAVEPRGNHTAGGYTALVVCLK